MRGEFVDVGGARLYCYAAGTRGAGEPVIFIHGFPTSGHLWRDVLPAMPEGHRAVVLDLLGYGRSDAPGGRALGVNAHADRVLGLLDTLGVGQACVVGHGLGGGVAQSLALRARDRVSRLCLIDSVAFDGWPSAVVRSWRRLSLLVGVLPPTWIQSIMCKALERGYASERGARSLEQYARVFGAGGGRSAMVQHLRALECSETVTLGARLHEISVPTAIVWGGQDPFLSPALGERLRDAIPGATLEVVPSAGHFTPEDTPAAVASAVARLLGR